MRGAHFLHPAGHDSVWLRLIGAGKALKALALVAIGIGVLRLVNTNFGEQMAQLADILRYSTVSRIFTVIFDKASVLTDRSLERLALFAFIYALTEIVEGYGLLRRRLWAEYMTLSFTIAMLPFDIFETARRFSWPKLVFTVANALIAWYLAWHIRRKRALRHQRAMAAAEI